MTIIPENPTLKYFCPVTDLLFYIRRKETGALMTRKQRHVLINEGNVHENATIVKAAKRQTINHIGAQKYLTGASVAGSGAKSKNPEVIERLDHLDGVGGAAFDV